MITITEALAEIKTIEARITKRQEGFMRYLVRPASMRDPLEKDGGSAQVIQRDRQAIHDLEERLVQLRTGIQDINLRTLLSLNGSTRSLAAWLNWRREVSANQRQRLQVMAQAIAQARQQWTRQAQIRNEDIQPGDLVIALNEQELSAQIDSLETILGELDGKLSLLNATTLIDL